MVMERVAVTVNGDSPLRSRRGRAVGSPGGQESFRGAFEAAGRAAQRVFFGMGSELRHDDDLGISHALDPQGLRIDDDGAGGLDWKGKAQRAAATRNNHGRKRWLANRIHLENKTSEQRSYTSFRHGFAPASGF